MGWGREVVDGEIEMPPNVGATITVKLDRHVPVEEVRLDHHTSSNVWGVADLGKWDLWVSNIHTAHQPEGCVIDAEVVEQIDQQNRIVADYETIVDADPTAAMPSQQQSLIRAAGRTPSESVKQKKEMGRPVYLPPTRREEIERKARAKLQAASPRGEDSRVDPARLRQVLTELDVDPEIVDTAVDRVEMADEEVTVRNLNHLLKGKL